MSENNLRPDHYLTNEELLAKIEPWIIPAGWKSEKDPGWQSLEGIVERIEVYENLTISWYRLHRMLDILVHRNIIERHPESLQVRKTKPALMTAQTFHSLF